MAEIIIEDMIMKTYKVQMQIKCFQELNRNLVYLKVKDKATLQRTFLTQTQLTGV